MADPYGRDQVPNDRITQVENSIQEMRGDFNYYREKIDDVEARVTGVNWKRRILTQVPFAMVLLMVVIGWRSETARLEEQLARNSPTAEERHRLTRQQDNALCDRVCDAVERTAVTSAAPVARVTPLASSCWWGRSGDGYRECDCRCNVEAFATKNRGDRWEPTTVRISESR